MVTEPRTTHPCGCVTYFDVAAWRSRTPVACAYHARFTAEGTP